MIPDTSALIAAFAPWHEHHDAAREALRGIDDLVAHTELEAYSVLTRLPAPFRTSPAIVAEHLTRRYRGARLVLPAPARRQLIGRLAELSISGGNVYDALIGATAQQAARPLVSADRRAAPIYEAIGVEVHSLDGSP